MGAATAHRGSSARLGAQTDTKAARQPPGRVQGHQVESRATSSGDRPWPGIDTSSGDRPWPGIDTRAGDRPWPGIDTRAGDRPWPGIDTRAAALGDRGWERLPHAGDRPWPPGRPPRATRSSPGPTRRADRPWPPGSTPGPVSPTCRASVALEQPGGRIGSCACGGGPGNSQ